ncbi:EF-hand domain-containing protein D2-like isoform X1 [Tachypleus tridentatus]|uniref:EF-hand domain-containing protein D2-like isoform X1 n=1 Tax=Tachypleus tridentatus TaxID=6853 RepID=UPI003FD29353
MADSELAQKLARRQAFNEREEGSPVPESTLRQVFNPYTEFPEFSRKEIKEYEKTFKKYDIGADGFIDFEELKRMMESVGAPQTHLALKEMIQEVDEDQDKKISFREFLLIFRKAQTGDLAADSGLNQLAKLTEIDVDQAGVSGARNFFEAKVGRCNDGFLLNNKRNIISLKRKFAQSRKNDVKRKNSGSNVKLHSEKKPTFSAKHKREAVK